MRKVDKSYICMYAMIFILNVNKDKDKAQKLTVINKLCYIARSWAMTLIFSEN